MPQKQGVRVDAAKYEEYFTQPKGIILSSMYSSHRLYTHMSDVLHTHKITFHTQHKFKMMICRPTQQRYHSFNKRFALTSELVTGGLVVGELLASEGSEALTNVAAGAIEGNTATERSTLGSGV